MIHVVARRPATQVGVKGAVADNRIANQLRAVVDCRDGDIGRFCVCRVSSRSAIGTGVLKRTAGALATIPRTERDCIGNGAIEVSFRLQVDASIAICIQHASRRIVDVAQQIPTRSAVGRVPPNSVAGIRINHRDACLSAGINVTHIAADGNKIGDDRADDTNRCSSVFGLRIQCCSTAVVQHGCIIHIRDSDRSRFGSGAKRRRSTVGRNVNFRAFGSA